MHGKLLLGLLCLLLAGCESLSEATGSLREKIAARDDGRTKAYPAPARAVYEAVRTVATQMGYRVLRGGAAQGELDAVSEVGQGETARSARQVAMKVRLRASEMAGGTEVNVRFTEILEADASNRRGLATESPLRDTPQYEIFLRRVGELLGTPGAK